MDLNKGIWTVAASLLFFVFTASTIAALELTSFSCEKDTVFVGDSFKCQATIKNTGSSDVNIYSVSLKLDGGWAERTTYSGLGFASMLKPTASTTATFEIRSTITGVHGFSGISGDPVISYDKEAEKVSPSTVKINVVAPVQYMSPVIAPDEAPQGTGFTVSTTLTAAGDLRDIYVTFYVTSGTCSLVSDATKHIDGLDDGTMRSLSWKLTQGSDTCNFKIEIVNASAGSGTVFGIGGIVSGSVGVETAPPPTVGVGAGAPAPTITVTNETGLVNITIPSISAGGTATVDIPATENMYLTRLVIKVRNRVTNVKIGVTTLAARPTDIPDVEGEAYHYYKIDKQNIGDEDIDNVTVEFKVEGAWMSDNDVDPATIVLSRYSGGAWDALPTSKLREDSDYAYYSAVSPGLSIFAISGTVKPAPTPAPTTAPPVATPAPTTPPPTAPLAITPPPVTPPPGVPKALIGAVVLIISLIAVAVYVLDRRGTINVRESIERLKKK
jgi:PGF-pre-PGF domain-containing protein